jgi:hypothetical protein
MSDGQRKLEDRWSEVSPLLDEALDLTSGAREVWLADLEARKPELAAHVRACLLGVAELAERKFAASCPPASLGARSALTRWSGRSGSEAWAPCGWPNAATVASKGKWR